MKPLAEFRLGGLKVHLEDPIDISISLKFGGPQPNAYGVPPATSEAVCSGDLVGDTRRGGSCNFEQYSLIPHCNGTHTECVGHITNERISVPDCLRDSFVPSLLLTIEPNSASNSEESYSVKIKPTDRLITRDALEKARNAIGDVAILPEALIVRTLPNTEAKLSQKYGDEVPPYFTTEAMEFIVENGFRHLVVDLPSIDRLYDEGKLSNHRRFWSVEPGSFEVGTHTKVNNTITELAYVPDGVADGLYVMNLQIAPFQSDAAPSRPLLFRLDAQ
jgi:arylformamidase